MNQLVRESSMQNDSINTVQGRVFTAASQGVLLLLLLLFLLVSFSKRSVCEKCAKSSFSSSSSSLLLLANCCVRDFMVRQFETVFSNTRLDSSFLAVAK